MTRGAFRSTKTFENLETEANGTEIIQKLLNFQNVKHSLNKKKKCRYTSRGCPLFWKFWKILFHSLLPECRRKFKPDVLVEWKTPKVNWRDLSRVGPIGPSNYICAKKNERNFVKFFVCKILCLPFFGDNNALFFNLKKQTTKQNKMRYTVFSRRALIQNLP